MCPYKCHCVYLYTSTLLLFGMFYSTINMPKSALHYCGRLVDNSTCSDSDHIRDSVYTTSRFRCRLPTFPVYNSLSVRDRVLFRPPRVSRIQAGDDSPLMEHLKGNRTLSPPPAAADWRLPFRSCNSFSVFVNNNNNNDKNHSNVSQVKRPLNQNVT